MPSSYLPKRQNAAGGRAVEHRRAFRDGAGQRGVLRPVGASGPATKWAMEAGEGSERWQPVILPHDAGDEEADDRHSRQEAAEEVLGSPEVGSRRQHVVEDGDEAWNRLAELL